MVDSDEIDYQLASKPYLQIHSRVYACTIIYKYFQNVHNSETFFYRIINIVTKFEIF